MLRQKFQIDKRVIHEKKFMALDYSTQMLYVWMLANCDNAGVVPKVMFACPEFKTLEAMLGIGKLLDSGYVSRYENGKYQIEHFEIHEDIPGWEYKGENADPRDSDEE